MTDVVVAGAGPVGLLLACELRLAGVTVVVLERNTEIDLTVKAGYITVPGIQALDRRGLSPAIERARDETLARMGFAGRGPVQQKMPRFIGHFGGMMLDGQLLDPDDPDIAAGGRFSALGMVSQQQLEVILEERARALGAEVRRGVTLTDFEQHADGVVVTTDQGLIEAGWLAGCDGGRSTVRKLAGFAFPGTDPEITAYQAIADMIGTEGLRPGWHITDTGVYTFGPFPGRILVAEFDGAPADRTSPVTVDELQGAIRRVTGVDVTVTGISSVTRFTDNARQAGTYRSGRVLLAGDAAHVHSPFGGQGINLGLGDAMNLGWKLAATIRGWAPDGLLDTYTAERHPIGAQILDWTRAQIAIMRPDQHSRAIRGVLQGLTSTVDATTWLAKRISGVWQGYDLPGDHPLTGRSAPDLTFDDGTRLPDHLHSGRALLVDLADDPDLPALATGYADRLTVHSAKAATSDLTAALIRPDGYVAWASSGSPTTDLRHHLTTWLGNPA
ncbi:FAD-dependent oxidoreductase [Actinoplanes sp. SE50]|uniref:FAD-dependent oxidoreductase n=1 Tax=unclassified Actinoplanes TaxID=2626549 RepID=UPI00023EC7F3|nr:MULTISPECIES: FAD-dependent oxidoreductase [unclassified Actinoplanes]AEV85335.1 monooxygenase FAD-binding protein [Actinoplanes sp. SE50/110]ATO83730.1 FAD-dependent oxidoreductase [Actinoplanes sp. SE50]SLM01138.1 FAD-dependent oxidoreductase [Actinoplanes sp. SE50/110]